MLPIVLVLLVATSALAAPSVTVNKVLIQDTSKPYDAGAGVNRGLVAGAQEMYDGADTNIYILTLYQIIQDLAGQPNSYSQALAISQLIAILGEIANGIPGNSCAAASAITESLTKGDGCSYSSTLASYIDNIAALGSNPASLRYSTSSSGNCPGNGSNYDFEGAWTRILDNASPDILPLVNEAYCSAARLRNAFSIRSNNVAAAFTAASLPQVVERVRAGITPIANFLRAAVNGNGYALAGAAKRALQ